MEPVPGAKGTPGVDMMSATMSLDDIDDLPGFNVFPSGAYSVCLIEGIVDKKIGEHPASEIQMKLVETLEISQPVPEAELPKVGDICSTAYMRDNPTGMGKLKEFLVPLGVKLGTKVIAEIVAQSKGMNVMVVINRTHDAVKDRYYANIKKVVVL